MTLNQRFLIEKLTLMEKYRSEMDSFLKLSNKEIIATPEKYYSIERVFQLVVEVMVDINQHLIGELNLAPVDDLQSTFYPLGEKGILPADFAQKLAPVVGVRNRLVHQYEDINKKLFLKNLRDNFSQFETYSEHIKNYLSVK